MKGGSPSVNRPYGRGLFRDGKRWRALGDGLRHAGLQLWNRRVKIWGSAQNSQRWEMFATTTFAHNTLTVNGASADCNRQCAHHGVQPRGRFYAGHTDITSLYKGDLEKAIRGIAIVNKQYVLVRDEVAAPDKETLIRWTLLTPAEVKITGNNTGRAYEEWQVPHAEGGRAFARADENLEHAVGQRLRRAEQKAPFSLASKRKCPRASKAPSTCFLLPEGDTAGCGEVLDEWPASK